MHWRAKRARNLCAAPLLLAWAIGLGCAARAPRAAPVGLPSPAEITVVPVGLCEDYPEESRSLAEVRRDIALLQSAHVNLLRVSIGWDGVEPERGRYDLGFWDQFVAEMAAAGIRIIPYVAYTPRWASSAPARDDYWKRPPADVARFAEIMSLLAARYRGRISSWEIWNEPDNPDFWAGTVGDYAALLAAGARAVKAADPEATVVLGGIAGHPQFAAEVMARPALGPLVDVVNAHAYFETWNGDAIETLPAYVATFAAALRAPAAPGASATARPLWLAEVGYSDYRPPDGGAQISPDYRARYPYEHTLPFQAVALVRMAALALATPPVALFAWYEVKDPAQGAAMIGDDNNRHLGVAFSDWRPKPALAALALVQRLFGQGFARLDGRLRLVRPPGSRAEAHAFLSAAGRAVVIVWLPTADPPDRVEHLAVELPLAAAGDARRLDAEGNERQRLTVRAAPAPGPGLRLPDVAIAGGEVAILEIPIAP